MFFGFLLNIILDPAFMYGWWGLPAMGVAGVAWATVLVQFLGILVFIYAVNKRGMLANSLHFYIPKKEIGIRIMKQAIPSSLNQANNAIGFLIITRFVADFGENALATFGVGMRIDQLIVLPAIGIATASISIVGQNYGAKKFDRIKETYQISLKYGILLLLVGSVLVLAFSKQLASLFTSDPILISSISNYLWVITFSYIPTAIVIISGAVLQGLGKSHHTLGINMMRFFVIMIPSLWVMAYWMNMHETGVWFGFVVSSVLMAIIAYWYTLKTINRK
jgi:putative MATE family efflux protein